MWPWGILGVCHQGSVSISRCLSWTGASASPGVKWQIRSFTSPKSVSPHRIFHVFPCQSPKFLSCSFIVLQHTALTPSHPQPLNQGHGSRFPEKRSDRKRGKAVWIWPNSSSLTSAQTQRTTQTGLTECTFKAYRSCQPGRGGQKSFLLSLSVSSQREEPQKEVCSYENWSL